MTNRNRRPDWIEWAMVAALVVLIATQAVVMLWPLLT